MATQIFVNLPVKDLNRSKAFFEGLGYTFNPQFSNDMGACMVVSDTIYFMLLTEPFFKTFTNKEIADASQFTEAINCLSVESKDKVNELVDKALATGGSTAKEPVDYGWMYSRSFHDPDNHQWEIVYMDPAGPPAQ
jgi:predicted lactoylglutathione lyase